MLCAAGVRTPQDNRRYAGNAAQLLDQQLEYSLFLLGDMIDATDQCCSYPDCFGGL